MWRPLTPSGCTVAVLGNQVAGDIDGSLNQIETGIVALTAGRYIFQVLATGGARRALTPVRSRPARSCRSRRSCRCSDSVSPSLLAAAARPEKFVEVDVQRHGR